MEMFSHDDTEELWASLFNIYCRYLEISNGQVAAIVAEEHLKDISEFIGIAYGILALTSEFSVQLNRIQRFTPTGRKKRVDFEFVVGGSRYFHETKGTTYENRVSKLRQDILKQKSSTRDYCAKPGQTPATACTGSIALYPHRDRPDVVAQVLLIDPPPEESSEGVPLRGTEELASVLRYYQTFYAVTHANPQGARLISLARWLAEIIKDLNRGVAPPARPPANLMARGRRAEPGLEDSPYKGTIFDARQTVHSARRFASFQEASRNIVAPITFVGVSEEVTRMIAACQWDNLLGFTGNQTGIANPGADGTDILSTGILVKTLASNDEFDAGGPAFFSQLKKSLAR